MRSHVRARLMIRPRAVIAAAYLALAAPASAALVDCGDYVPAAPIVVQIRTHQHASLGRYHLIGAVAAPIRRHPVRVAAHALAREIWRIVFCLDGAAGGAGANLETWLSEATDQGAFEYAWAGDGSGSGGGAEEAVLDLSSFAPPQFEPDRPPLAPNVPTIPEPSTIALIATGLAAMFLLASHNNRLGFLGAFPGNTQTAGLGRSQNLDRAALRRGNRER
jgi:PEP-CTERM motif